jgi:hypothetical protein
MLQMSTTEKPTAASFFFGFMGSASALVFTCTQFVHLLGV